MQRVRWSFVLGLESHHLGASIPVEQVMAYVGQNAGSCLGFAGIDPMEDGHLKRAEEALAQGAAGFVFSPAAQAFHPSHTRAMALYEFCQDRGRPLICHGVQHLGTGAQLQYAVPYLLDDVAHQFPQLRLVITQVGYPWIDQTLVIIARHEHVYADVTDVVRRPWQLYNTLLLASQQGVMNKLVFGSDFPFCTPEHAIASILSVNQLAHGTHLPTVPREELRLLVERDALKCLGVSALAAAQAQTSSEASKAAAAGAAGAGMAEPAAREAAGEGGRG
jgi:predicted TIM-barrel fold metal-dependent hydrolase